MRISAPAAARDIAIAQPYLLPSATLAINARLPANNCLSVRCLILASKISTYKV